MYSNIGRKLKGLAKFLAIVGVIIGILMFLLAPRELLLSAVLIAASSFVGSWPLYGFGELIEKVSFIAARMKGGPGKTAPPGPGSGDGRTERGPAPDRAPEAGPSEAPPPGDTPPGTEPLPDTPPA